ncbi:type II toxin-antitoxin system HicB family antitoxin [Planktothrix sp. FACHB-1365]|uniref:type II toxin-antitoxin system HicB family antitoxin n=1 Tax=Planktothrix sp. FACHB-1365 TaxID=2692855 RepID=UPI00168660EA|nr:type II toxin-antitoxin system HicB family antitoxin [Planktothrix sp. FACHB-1365]MBD2484491.1 type II toxin-antitoxin system HicB family antitoxin [Planktothrix sp. FACHB-1365]
MLTNSPPLITSVNKVNYEVGIKRLKNGKYQTFVLDYPSLKASANSRDEALQKLSQRLQAFFKDTEIIQLEIEIPQPEHPWLQFAGMFENDPLFEKVLEAIQDYRNEIDAEEE